jgi:hypothetical protein
MTRAVADETNLVGLPLPPVKATGTPGGNPEMEYTTTLLNPFDRSFGDASAGGTGLVQKNAARRRKCESGQLQSYIGSLRYTAGCAGYGDEKVTTRRDDGGRNT